MARTSNGFLTNKTKIKVNKHQQQIEGFLTNKAPTNKIYIYIYTYTYIYIYIYIYIYGKQKLFCIDSVYRIPLASPSRCWFWVLKPEG